MERQQTQSSQYNTEGEEQRWRSEILPTLGCNNQGSVALVKGQTDRWTKTHLHNYSQLIFDKGAKAIQCSRESFLKMVLEQLDILMQKKKNLALAGVALWTEGWPKNQKVVLWFPVRAHAQAAGQVLSWGHAIGNQSMYLLHINASFPLFLPPLPSL